jgi:hypothetical protein
MKKTRQDFIKLYTKLKALSKSDYANEFILSDVEDIFMDSMDEKAWPILENWHKESTEFPHLSLVYKKINGPKIDGAKKIQLAVQKLLLEAVALVRRYPPAYMSLEPYCDPFIFSTIQKFVGWRVLADSYEREYYGFRIALEVAVREEIAKEQPSRYLLGLIEEAVKTPEILDYNENTQIEMSEAEDDEY